MTTQRKKLINHTMMGAYPHRELKDIPGVWHYGARALCNTSPGELIQLHPETRGEHPWVDAHYRRVGLMPTSDIIWDASLGVVRDYPEADWDVFLFSEHHHKARPDSLRLSATSAMNDKNQFLRVAMLVGAPVPATVYFDHKQEYLSSPPTVPFPLYFKVACSAAGMGVIHCKDEVELAKAVANLEDDVPFQLQQPVVEPQAFLNVQYEAVGTEVRRIGLTEQILDGFSHAGNRYPSRFNGKLWDVCDPVAEMVGKLGVKGVFAFDVAVAGNGDYQIIECNPRPNAVTYYFRVAQQLGLSHWCCKNVGVKTKTLSGLDLLGLEFDQRRGDGAIVISWATILQGKAGVLFGGRSAEQCNDLFANFMSANGKKN